MTEAPVQIVEYASVFQAINKQAAFRWREIGVQLDLQSYVLDAISADSRDDPKENMSEVFRLWKEQSQNQTWNSLIKAIKITNDNEQLYENLKTKHRAGLLDMHAPSIMCHK